jgi:MFS transporter, putative metabolite:H+ symporter
MVAALGYFVDIYDLLLFNIIRKASLEGLGLSTDQVTVTGENIISFQMAGMLLGGIIWGIMGDKKGRLSVLFGSIILYSLANIANGFVSDPVQYSIIRFFAGMGLAGEIGAGITLIAEILPKERRGLGTSLMAAIGMLGAVSAYFISKEFPWRTCYFIGGGLGLLLLVLRISVFESGMFESLKKANVARGNFFMLLNNAKRFKKYITSILIGLPSWYVVGVLIAFSDQFGKSMGIKGEIIPGKAVMISYAAASIGDIASGFLSQWFKSRKKTLFFYYGLFTLFITLYFLQSGGTSETMYWICGGLGLATGFWAMFVTIAAEQFGTNLRATAATTITNMVRGTLPLIILLFKSLRSYLSYLTAGIIIGIIVMLVAIISASFIQETFKKDLNYVET